MNYPTHHLLTHLTWIVPTLLFTTTTYFEASKLKLSYEIRIQVAIHQKDGHMQLSSEQISLQSVNNYQLKSSEYEAANLKSLLGRRFYKGPFTYYISQILTFN